MPAEYVGFCSANYDKKFPRPPHLDALPRLRGTRPGEGLGPGLSSRWLAGTDASNPGMAAVLERVATHFGLTVRPVHVPYANTFVCHRDEWFRLLDAFEPMLTAVLDWYGPRPPYRYRCPRCGFWSPDTGNWPVLRTTAIGYLAERITMLHFASRPDIQFVTPTALRLRTSRLLRSRAKLHGMVKRRGIRVPRPGLATSVTSLDGPGVSRLRGAGRSNEIGVGSRRTTCCRSGRRTAPLVLRASQARMCPTPVTRVSPGARGPSLVSEVDDGERCPARSREWI